MDNDVIRLFLSLHETEYSFFKAVCGRLSNEQLWERPAKGLPIANIICHVCEMEGFWIDWGLCGNEFERQRQIEFDRHGDITGPRLMERLDARHDQTVRNVKNLDSVQWEKEREFHGDIFTGGMILAWHLRHMGLHRGHVQILERWIISR